MGTKSRGRKSMVVGLLAAGLFQSVCGCTPISWQRYRESQANPAVWMRSLFPPEGEDFYTDQAHDIERSLNRHRSGGGNSLE